MNLNELTPVQQVRMQNWIQIIRECQSSGMTNKEWCEQNGISTKSYYYHLAKIRRLALAEIPRKTLVVSEVVEEPTFTEVKVVKEEPVIQSPVVIHKGAGRIEINQKIDASILKMILEAL